MKIVCVYHSIDLDGWMSAAIVKYRFILNSKDYRIFDADEMKLIANTSDNNSYNQLYFLKYNYGDTMPELLEYDLIIMCDISVPTFRELVEVQHKEIIWLDHHISAIRDSNDYANMKGIKGIRDVKYATCELTWKYFFPNEQMPEIVRLLGRYDCFGHKGTNEEQKVLEFQYGARSIISNYEDAYKYLLEELSQMVHVNNDRDNIINRIIKAGKNIYEYLCVEAKQSYNNKFDIFFPKQFEIEKATSSCPFCDSVEIKYDSPYRKYECGTISYDDYRINKFDRSDKCISNTYKFACINKERFNPINFNINYHKDGYDGVACFYRTKTGMWSFSLYNDNGLVDCSIIANYYGGGGHKGAAGMIVDTEIMLQIIK